jgi:dienelactone hydrolase
MRRGAGRGLVGVLCVAGLAAAQTAPLLIYVPGGSGQVPSIQGWEVVAAKGALPTDEGVHAIETAVETAWRGGKVDPMRTYIAGQGLGSAAVFYAISRRPDLWAAALALGGSPRPAIDSNRLFGVNTDLVPLLWLTTPEDQKLIAPLAAKLRQAGYNLEMAPAGATAQQAFDWLAGHKRDPFPSKVDCETGNPEFARCYWVQITQFDPKQRNDVLPSARVIPGTGAMLAIGGFGYRLDAPGPGVLVEWLPPNYKGPLQIGDRLMEISGAEIRDGQAYSEMMDQIDQEKTVGVMVERGKKRLRLESRILLPRRMEATTARVQAQYLSDARELLVISRGASELRVTLPSYWVPCPINWNGSEMGKADAPGCWTLAMGATVQPCR